ncbi:MAG: hypothetical protein QGI46_02760 [Planctomycetota bacterium]|jgi:hypothetical protein|nr:hypothetical protein [Planctomycetota bacterium]
MARRGISVTYKSTDATRIPDQLTEGAALFMDLVRRGVVDSASEHVRIRRQGGYSGVDVWLFLLLFFTTGAQRGVRTFWDKLLRSHMKQLAALAGRRKLPAPASMSRALDKAEPELVRVAAPWLLMDMPEVDDVLRHPATMSYDALGQGWHLFDVDPTVTTLRQRALPTGDDLPEPLRCAEDTAAPGYSGRKRGDVQFRRNAVEHHGSSLWLHGHLSPGNGEGVVDFELALDAVARTCDRIEHPRSRALVRMDGEHGHVPWFTACRERGLPFITRLNRQKLYQDPEVLRRLRSATWHRVPDSLAGPGRSAADIGVLRIHPDKRTRRPDGSAYEPIEVRVVASIFPKKGKAKRGRTLDGWQVELFAVDVPADAWPAPEAVASYFGHAAEENRFAQEDREVGLDRIISYHLPGQELASVVGMSLWNYRVVRGFWQDPPPAEPPVQRPRNPRVDDRVPEHWPRDPVVHKALGELDWSALLAKRPGWRWDAAAAELRCVEGRELTLTSVRPTEHAEGRSRVILRRPLGGCEDCSVRPGCLDSTRKLTCKHAEFAVPTPIAGRLRDRLAAVRGLRRNTPTIAPVEGQAGPAEVVDSLLLPAVARQGYSAIFRGATLKVVVERPQPEPPWPRLVAVDVADRQRRRKTWTQNADRYALPAGTKVHVEVAGSMALRRMLGEREPPAAAAGGRG